MTKALVAAVNTEVAKETLCPIFLVTVSASTTYRYAFFEVPVEYDGNTYTGIHGQVGDITEDTELAVEEIEIKFGNVDRVFSAMLLAANPLELRGVEVSIIRVFQGLLSDATAYEPIFDGIIWQWSMDEQYIKFKIKDWVITLQDDIPRRRCNRQCPWQFGSTNTCKLTPSAAPGAGEYKRVTGQTCDSGCTTTQLVDAARTEAADYWKAGYITFSSGNNNGLKYAVKTSATGTVDPEVPFAYAPAAADQYTIEQNCDFSAGTCKSRFNNMVNYGGNLSVPRKSYR